MSIWQTKKWGEMLKMSNQADQIFEVNGIFIEKRRVSLREFGFFILGIEKSIKKQDLEEMLDICKKENALFLQIETLEYNGNKKINIDGFNKGYYKKFITPYTAVIDLTKTEDEILSLMKPKGRYNIKLAGKKGVEIKEVEKTDKNVKKYYKLMLDTTTRDSFSGNSLEYYKNFLENLENSKLLLAYVDNRVIAGGIFTFDTEVSIYYYGASTSDKKYRNLMAPYLLQWEAIKIAKLKGSKLYDFLGVASPGHNNSSLIGVTDFKKKLSKDIREVSNSYIYVNKKLKYFIIQILRKLKTK